ncbi:MAG TPA: hypothetical protein VNQ72_00730, partial [Candidatus Dormibacteraeota bacterium]|nr:hypothetical protein [Candidatus Dormibacteraeota bacterium]
MLDGVFNEGHAGALEFHPAPAPTDGEVAAVLVTIHHQIRGLLVRRGLEPRTTRLVRRIGSLRTPRCWR